MSWHFVKFHTMGVFITLHVTVSVCQFPQRTLHTADSAVTMSSWNYCTLSGIHSHVAWL
jgi:hypothetical protein